MPESRKPIHRYPTFEPKEDDKYLPSFFFDVSFDKQVFKAEIRPLKKDRGYFTVSLDNIFISHIHKLGGQWKDVIGGSTQLYQVIGKLIEDHLK